jgi:hypothetical protein
MPLIWQRGKAGDEDLGLLLEAKSSPGYYPADASDSKGGYKAD